MPDLHKNDIMTVGWGLGLREWLIVELLEQHMASSRPLVATRKLPSPPEDSNQAVQLG